VGHRFELVELLVSHLESNPPPELESPVLLVRHEHVFGGRGRLSGSTRSLLPAAAGEQRKQEGDGAKATGEEHPRGYRHSLRPPQLVPEPVGLISAAIHAAPRVPTFAPDPRLRSPAS